MSKNIPEKIFLIIGGNDNDCNFDELSEVTWAKERIYENDIEYVLDQKKDLIKKVSSLKNKYDHGELNDIYNLAIFDVLEILK